MEPIGGKLPNRNDFKVRPRYTVVLHDVREKLKLSLTTYVVIDSVHKLSTSNPNFPYCTMSKEKMADFLLMGRTSVFRAIDEGVKKKLIERTTDGFLRSTRKWVELVEIYSITKR